MTKQMTVRDFVRGGFTITEDTSGSGSVEAIATAEMRQRGYKFVGYDDNGDELMSNSLSVPIRRRQKHITTTISL